MIKYVLKKIAYGILVLLGVITVVFCIYNIKPGDPASMSGGQNTNKDIIENFNKEWGLDQPILKRYFHFVNDLSPVSVYNHTTENSFIYYEQERYNGFKLFSISDKYALYTKAPYLKRSYLNNRNVSDLISEKLIGTAILAFASILFASLLGILLGSYSAYNNKGFIDKFSLIFSIAGMSAPSFFMASIISVVGGYYWSSAIHFPVLPLIFILLFIVLKSIKLKNQFRIKTILKNVLKGFAIGLGIWLMLIILRSIFQFQFLDILLYSFEIMGTGLEPSGSIIQLNDITGEKEYNWSNLVLPCITLGLRPLAIVLLLTKKSMEEVLSSDFIRTAKAKGLSTFQILWKHALRNAINPVITAISGWFASLLAGAVFVEMIFNWDGIGSILVNALKNDDLPVVMGITLVISVIFVIINLIVDVIYSIIDPRVVLK
ncbi:MAG: ABC transporter permease [Bacteroidota bacterium]|nr:ABC transporter permease [Bacteroidota bacterium]